MERRRFVGLVGIGMLAEPFEAQAQTPIPVIGYLSGRTVASEAPIREPLLKSLEASGFVVGTLPSSTATRRAATIVSPIWQPNWRGSRWP
jgi:hypothetical protein